MDIKLIGELIKEYRISHKMSLRDFAKKANVSHTYISMLEKNFNPATEKAPVINLNNLNNIALALGLSLDEFLTIITENIPIEIGVKGQFQNRLLKAMNYRNITQIELSQKSGVDKGSISHYLKGTYEPKLGKAQKLADALNVSVEWLMGADVPMLKEPKKVELKEIKSAELFLNPDLDLSEMVRIPIVSTVPASFNKSSDFIYDEYIEYPVSLLQYSDYDKRYIVLRIKGYSMYPELFDGDSVLVDIFLEVQNGDIGVFAFNDEFTVKRIYFQKDTVVFKPSNPEFQEKVYTKKELHEMGYHPIGRVVKIIERKL